MGGYEAIVVALCTFYQVMYAPFTINPPLSMQVE